jgi:hypothetical protein
MRSPVILLHADDNVVVCRRSVVAGERISIEGSDDVIALANIEIGHKLARVGLPASAKVIKYGAAIGSTTEAVRAGDWVHLHNMKSDYIGAHTRAATGEDK